MNLVEIAQSAAAAAEEKKAQRVTILDIRGLSAFADYFVVCHGNSQKQVQAIAEAVKERMAEKNVTMKGLEGYREARWVLIDIGDVVVHVFHKDERDFYDLERLWGDAAEVSAQ
ncbi:ribosome-associated protein [Marininema mesophilum]|uniref:Ribosomal silencing factor RsfS n=1 Tax=Marininema mesophilum TaxID=1048340 RepID=A0A1H2Y314_9BACL|nr:ribosome silencing factor [Marininema mesophilum]SDW99188.1 ribosome-associated protein [Marininema mesophilum]